MGPRGLGGGREAGRLGGLAGRGAKGSKFYYSFWGLGAFMARLTDGWSRGTKQKAKVQFEEKESLNALRRSGLGRSDNGPLRGCQDFCDMSVPPPDLVYGSEPASENILVAPRVPGTSLTTGPFQRQSKALPGFRPSFHS